MSTSSHHLFARNLDHFNPKCPEGAQWYACPKSSGSDFVGCCSSDPCSSRNGCSQGNIRPVSFNASLHGTPDFPPDASCGTGSDFYTCVSGKAGDNDRKTFWGCCKTVPCGTQSCPSGDLVPAFMSNTNQYQAYIGEGSGANPSASPSPSAEPQSTKNTAVIVGGAVGGAVAIVTIISILIFCLCRRRKAKGKAATPDVAPAAENGTAAAAAAATPGEKTPAWNGSAYDEAAPPYTSPNPGAHPAMLAPLSGYKNQYQPVSQQPQELPVELPSGPSTSRYSELPAGSQTARLAEMESPIPSPRPGQGAFAGDGGKPSVAELASPQMTPSVPQGTLGK